MKRGDRSEQLWSGFSVRERQPIESGEAQRNAADSSEPNHKSARGCKLCARSMAHNRPYARRAARYLAQYNGILQRPVVIRPRCAARQMVG